MLTSEQARKMRTERPIPANESERAEEAMRLILSLTATETAKLTTFEVDLVDSLNAGRAATRVRLKMLRETIERVRSLA